MDNEQQQLSGILLRAHFGGKVILSDLSDTHICVIGIEVISAIERMNRTVLVHVDDEEIARSKDLEPGLPALEWEMRKAELCVWFLQIPLVIIDQYPLANIRFFHLSSMIKIQIYKPKFKIQKQLVGQITAKVVDLLEKGEYIGNPDLH